MNWKFVGVCCGFSVLSSVIPAMVLGPHIANSQGAAMRAMDRDCPPTAPIATAPAPIATEPAPVQSAPEEQSYGIDWAGLGKAIGWQQDQPAQAERGATWLQPTGSQVAATPQAVKRLRYLADGGAGQNVESIYRILGRPSRVMLDDRTQKAAIAYWDTSGGTVIGVVAESGDQYLGVSVN
jgi:hypothetical protein